MNSFIVTQVVEQLTTLPGNLQEQVLKFVQALHASFRDGIPGRQLLRFAGVISLDDLQLMRYAIETGCEQVELNEW